MNANITAQSVSAHLRRLGYRPTGNRNRQGLRVAGGNFGRVRVVADLDADGAAERMASEVAADLTEAGYVVDLDGQAMYVSRQVAS